MGRRDALGIIGAGVASVAAAPAAVAAGAGVASVAAAPAAVAAGAGGTLNLASPEGRLRAYMLMRGALDDRLVIGCASGRYYGVVDEELTPLFGVVSATFSRYRPLATGGFRVANCEFAYFTDPKTGQALGPFVNPYTGETVQVPGGGYAPTAFTIRPDLRLDLGGGIPGMVFDQQVLPVEVRGDDVWFTELVRTSRAVAGQPKPFRYSETVMLHARRSELERPGIKRVTCETNFTNVVGWRPWLKMTGHPGHMMAVGTGRYGATLATLPQAWIDATRAQRPELLADPIKILDPVWKAGT